jgi:hypothetical protein
MKDSLSPEEKLLKLIRGEKKQKAPPSVTAREGISVKQAIPAPIDDQPPVKGFVPKVTAVRPKSFPLYPLIGIAGTLSFIFLIAAFLYPVMGLGKIRLPEVVKEEGALLSSEAGPQVEPLETYLEGLKARQIFAAATASEATAVSPVAVKNTLDLFKDITLVGIISSDPPQAVIEDKKTQKTYYLSRGQSLGDLKVDDIQEGKVVLDYLGTEYELYM